MKRIFFIFTLTLCFIFVIKLNAQNVGKDEFVPHGGARLMVQVEGNDTILLAFLHDLWVFPKTTFKNKKQEQYFWRTVRDVKKVLPYAKLVASELNYVNMQLVDIKSEKDRKKYLNKYEKDLFKKHESNLRKMTVTQGRLLMKLIDRECERTSYDLIKAYRGNVSAFFWQGIARVFGSNLKVGYDAQTDDKLLERVILLVEAGQL